MKDLRSGRFPIQNPAVRVPAWPCARSVGFVVWFGNLFLSRRSLLIGIVIAAGLESWAARISPSIEPDPPRSGKVILVPIDDRPAVAQFAQMIGSIADHDVVMPPYELLGRFTRPGDTRRIGQWLRALDYSRVDALVVSVDMLAFGGLVASRAPGVKPADALRSLEFFRWFKAAHPRIPVYAFSVIMRVAPTADSSTRAWREDLARWAELMDRVPRTGDTALSAELDGLERKLGRKLTQDYMAARRRDLAVNLAMIDLRRRNLVDGLILLQDDARLYGLHRQDQRVLAKRLRDLRLEGVVPVYNGADEGSLSLVSRALLEKYRQPIKAALVFSSKKGQETVAPYEDRPLEYTVESQIRAAGAAPVSAGEGADYTLYVNAPETSLVEFDAFLGRMARDLKSGKSVALADVLFPPPHYSGADERIVEALVREGLVDRFTGYAAWNTAGNTLGTAIPQANMRILFRKRLNDDPRRSARSLAAHLEFLLHRFAGDYLYHDLVRPELNRELRNQVHVPTDEFPPEVHERVNHVAAERLRPLIEGFYSRHFEGRTYSLESLRFSRSLRLGGLRELTIQLPWARTFEAAIRYRVEYELLGAPEPREAR